MKPFNQASANVWVKLQTLGGKWMKPVDLKCSLNHIQDECEFKIVKDRGQKSAQKQHTRLICGSGLYYVDGKRKRWHMRAGIIIFYFTLTVSYCFNHVDERCLKWLIVSRLCSCVLRSTNSLPESPQQQPNNNRRREDPGCLFAE